jgi:hypothetical protein
MLRIAALVPIGAALSAAASTVGRIVDGAAASLRPAASGTSASRCGQCGSPDHTMLDPRCPAAPRIV